MACGCTGCNAYTGCIYKDDPEPVKHVSEYPTAASARELASTSRFGRMFGQLTPFGRQKFDRIMAEIEDQSRHGCNVIQSYQDPDLDGIKGNIVAGILIELGYKVTRSRAKGWHISWE